MAGLSCEGLVDINADWMADAVCKGMGTDVFFAERGERLVEARAMCNRCPVAEECCE